MRGDRPKPDRVKTLRQVHVERISSSYLSELWSQHTPALQRLPILIAHGKQRALPDLLGVHR